MTQHPEWAALNALVDGIASDATVAAHVAMCTECRRAVDGLTALRREARALPGAPSSALTTAETDALWQDIAGSVRRAQLHPHHAPHQEPHHAPHHIPRRVVQRVPWRVLAAAAAIAIVSTSATWWVMRTPTRVHETGLSVMPAAFARTEATYLDNVAQLRSDLDRLRDQLDPRTVAAVERSLDVIDVAILEVRDALLADPANAAVSELLASHYRQKIELLRRATQLTPAA